MFSLQDDDPQVQDIFRTEFTARLRARRSISLLYNGQHQPSQPSLVFEPSRRTETRDMEEVNEFDSNGIPSTIGATETSSRRYPNNRKGARPRARELSQHTRASTVPTSRRSTRLASKGLEPVQRLTRSTIGKDFYELDFAGTARLIQVRLYLPGKANRSYTDCNSNHRFHAKHLCVHPYHLK